MTETPMVGTDDERENVGLTPFVTCQSRKLESTPKVGRFNTPAYRKIVPRPSRHGYSTRSNMRTRGAMNSPGLTAKKDELSSQLSRMLEMVKLAPDREALLEVQQSFKSIVDSDH